MAQQDQAADRLAEVFRSVTSAYMESAEKYAEWLEKSEMLREPRRLLSSIAKDTAKAATSLCEEIDGADLTTITLANLLSRRGAVTSNAQFTPYGEDCTHADSLGELVNELHEHDNNFADPTEMMALFILAARVARSARGHRDIPDAIHLIFNHPHPKEHLK